MYVNECCVSYYLKFGCVCVCVCVCVQNGMHWWCGGGGGGGGGLLCWARQ